MNNKNIIVKNGRELRCGYTTGSCATAAASAAAQMLLTGLVVSSVNTILPNGESVTFDIDDVLISELNASCSVTKDAGDDPDVTDGMKIFAACSFAQSGIVLCADVGIGIVTKEGLACKVGEPAINPVPRAMIIKNVSSICEKYGYEKGISVTLSSPNGVEIAKKTYNPRIGIVGGISILGTTGIVEPMSEKALVDTIKLLIDQKNQYDQDKILVSPGNYGRDYCKNELKFDIDKAIKCSNYIGETLDYLAYKKYKKVLLVGHLGKLVKLAAGVMNTHSAMADCRMEVICAHSALFGGDKYLCRSIMDCVTTDAAIKLLESAGICQEVFDSIMKKIQFHIDYRVKGALEVEIIVFSQENIIAKSPNADSFAKMFTEEEKV